MNYSVTLPESAAIDAGPDEGSMLALLQAGPAALDRVHALTGGHSATVPLSDVQLLAPVPNPGTYMAIGMNYGKHVAEAVAAGFKIPDTQV